MLEKLKQREWLSLVVWVAIRVIERISGTQLLAIDDTDLAIGIGGFAASRGLAKMGAVGKVG